METLKTQNVFTGCVALPFEKTIFEQQQRQYERFEIKAVNLHKVQCFNKCLLCVEKSRDLGPVSSSVFCFLHTFLLTLHRGFDHTYMMESIWTVIRFTWKSTQLLFYKHPQLVPSHPCCAPSWQTQLLTAPSRRKNQPPTALFLFSLLNTSRVDSRADFPPPKFPCPIQQRFGIWSLDGNVSIRVHTTQSCADESPFTGYSSSCSRKFIVRGGWWWAPTGPNSDSPCRTDSLCSEQDRSMWRNVGSVIGKKEMVKHRNDLVLKDICSCIKLMGACET